MAVENFNPQDVVLIQSRKNLKIARENLEELKKQEQQAKNSNDQEKLNRIKNGIKQNEKNIKDAEKVINKLNDAPKVAVNKLITLLKGSQGQNKEIIDFTIQTLKHEFEKSEEALIKILGKMEDGEGAKVKALSILRDAYQKATGDEKKEVALVIQKFWLAELDIVLEDKTKEEQNVILGIKQDIAELERIVVMGNAYKIEGERDTSTDYSIQRNEKDNFSARKVKGETMKIFNQLSSKDQEMKLKISSHEKAMMKRFVELVDDISNNEGTKFDDVPVEVKLINYMKNNPEAARYNTEEEWIKALADRGLVIKKESWGSRILGWKEGAKDLAQFAKIYLSAEDVATANNNFSNLRNYVDMIYNEGGFKKTIDGLQKVAQSSKESFKKTKAERFNDLIGTSKLDSNKALNMLFDFNLDGIISSGDVEGKSGFQWEKAMKETLLSWKKADEIINNILAVVNKAEGLNEQSKITLENISKFENFEKVQNFLKTTALDAKDIVQYWKDAAKKSLENGSKLESVKKSDIVQSLKKNNTFDKVNEEITESVTRIGNQNELQRLKKQLEFLKTEEGQVLLREGLSSVIEQDLAKMNQSWVAVWADIPLDKIVKGLSINLALWKEGLNFNKLNKSNLINNLWFNIAWNGDLDLGKGWKAFAGANAGSVGRFIPFSQVQAGIAKKWGNLDNSLSPKTQVTTSMWASASASVRESNVGFGAWVNAGVDRNLNNSRELQAESIGKSIRSVFAELIPSMVKENEIKIDNTTEKKKQIKIDNTTIKTILEKKYNGTTQEDLNSAVDQISKYLKLYEGEDATSENIAQIIDSVSEAYTAAWSNSRARKLDEKWWYVSGGGLSLGFFAGCIPVVWLLKRRNHRYSGTVDAQKAQQKFSESMYSAENNRNLNEKEDANILELQRVRGKKIQLNWNQISIDVSGSLSNVFLDPTMKGNIYIESSKENPPKTFLTIHKDTKLRVVDNSWVWSSSKILNIGADRLTSSATRLSDVETDTERKVKESNNLKAQMTVENIQGLWESLNLSGLTVKEDENKKDFEVQLGNSKITLWKNQNLRVKVDGTLVAEDRKEWNFKIIVEKNQIVNETLQFEEKFSTAVDNFYKVLSDLSDQKLANYIHQKPKSSELSDWYSSRTFDNAKKLFNAIAKDLGLSEDKNFNGLLKYFDPPQEAKQEPDNQETDKQETDNQEPDKQKFMLLVDGMLSRTHNVIGRKDGKYDIMYWGKINTLDNFPRLINNTSSRILKKMGNDTKMNSVKNHYSTLFSAMNEAKVKVNENNNYTTEKLNNTIAYNFGNPHDLMKPIVNPYVVDWVLYEKKPEVPEEVKKNLLKELFGATDKALVKNLITQIAKDVSTTEDEVSNAIVNSLSWEWKVDNDIDIWKKKVKIKADFGTAFFAQCVNHMVTISNIEATIVWGSTIEQSLQGQNISVVQNESDGRTKMTDQKFAVAVGGSIDNREQEQPSGKDRQDGEGKSNPNLWDSPDMSVNSKVPWNGAANSRTTVWGAKDTVVKLATEE